MRNYSYFNSFEWCANYSKDDISEEVQIENSNVEDNDKENVEHLDISYITSFILTLLLLVILITSTNTICSKYFYKIPAFSSLSVELFSSYSDLAVLQGFLQIADYEKDTIQTYHNTSIKITKDDMERFGKGYAEQVYVRLFIGISPVYISDLFEIDFNYDDWYNSLDGYWYYKHAVGLGEETTPLIKDIKLNTECKAIENEDIITGIFGYYECDDADETDSFTEAFTYSERRIL